MTVHTSASLPELSAADVARARGWSRTTAWRWLSALEREFGPSVVSRRGRRLFTTASALARVAPTAGDDRTRSRIEALETTVAEQGRRIDTLVREFRAAVEEWRAEKNRRR